MNKSKPVATSRPQCGRIPYDPVDAGILAKMTGGDAKVYAAICVHADYTFTCDPGIRRLAALVKMQIGSVSRCLHRLEDIGAITIAWEGNGHPAKYRIVTVHNGANGHTSTTVHPPASQPFTGQPGTVHPLARDRSPQRERNILNKEKQPPPNRESHEAAGGGDASQDAAEEPIIALACDKLGIPKREKAKIIAADPPLTTLIALRHAVRNDPTAKNKTSCLVHRITNGDQPPDLTAEILGAFAIETECAINGKRGKWSVNSLGLYCDGSLLVAAGEVASAETSWPSNTRSEK